MAGWPATTWLTRWPRPAGRARWGRRSSRSRDGLRDFRPTSDRSPGRLNLFRLGQRVVIVDFAHNEAGISAVLDVAEGIAGGAAGRAAPITVIIGTAGDRPDDTLRGIGRIAAERAQRVAIKETLGTFADGPASRSWASCWPGSRPAAIRRRGAGLPVRDRGAPSRAQRRRSLADGRGARPEAARVVVLMCHEEREAVFALLDQLGARPIDVATELTELLPRLQERPRR